MFANSLDLRKTRGTEFMTARQLQEEILQLKQEKHAAILAHSYQAPEILEIADLRGDSFQLSTAAKEIECDTVIVCGVRFMADTVKLLSPEKKVILPVGGATCPMAGQVKPEQVRQYKAEHPDTLVVAYINTTTELKAECDVCVTSSSAAQIIANIEQDQILFLPDRNLGAFIRELAPQKEITLWDGCCPVHNAVTEEECLAAKAQYPGAPLAMHPECPPQALRHADFIGSTSAIIQFAERTEGDVIIGTEKSISDWLSFQHPDRRFPVASKHLLCPDMRLTTLAEVRRALLGTGGDEIVIDETLRRRALRPIEEMIRLGQG
jgi:quinolinate synthase